MLQYDPVKRIAPLQACAHPFFDELRNPATRLPSGRPLPKLFDFNAVEFGIEPDNGAPAAAAAAAAARAPPLTPRRSRLAPAAGARVGARRGRELAGCGGDCGGQGAEEGRRRRAQGRRRIDLSGGI